MALGDVVRTMQPTPIVIWRKGSVTPVAGDPVGFDTAGDIIVAINTTDGPLGMKTTNNKTVSAVIYYQVLIFGIGVMVADGAIKPNKFVVISTDSQIAAATTAVSATYVQAEAANVYRILGMYLMKESDPATNDFAVSDAAAGNAILVFVGRGL